MINLAGYWTGSFDGTNEGGVTLQVDQDGNKLTGIATMHEPKLGIYKYTLQGIAGNPQAQFELTPIANQSHVLLGKLKAIVALQKDGTIKGRWTSTLETNGSFTAKRYNQDSVDGLVPVKNSVFIVHGRDEAAKHHVARFVERLGIKPVILQEQMNGGMTIIEKFEDYAAKAGFAIVLVTPDDVGYLAGEEAAKKYRPRQNVILELGYFAAKLGRSKMSVLVKDDVEFPSDILGLVYHPLDNSGGWKLSLARELKAAGYEVDLNKELD